MKTDFQLSNIRGLDGLVCAAVILGAVGVLLLAELAKLCRARRLENWCQGKLTDGQAEEDSK